ncbi:hypothetical protein [Inquilinus sp. OTU3971]|uniref:hypothetical protein n=1 Tax=Inquilinus sp. OTU3971 TaxID=3043855 RepID=UPI00313D12B0
MSTPHGYEVMRSLSPANELTFVCPIFEREVEFRDCARQHEANMCGKRDQVEPGCAACMAANKCPVRHMLQEEWIERRTIYFSAEPRQARLSARVWDRIKSVLIPEFILKRFPVPDPDLAAINACNEAAVPAGASSDAPTRSKGRRAGKAPAPRTTARGVADAAPAADTTSYADVITRMAAKETAPSAPKPAPKPPAAAAAPVTPAAPAQPKTNPTPTSGKSLLALALEMKRKKGAVSA